MRTSDNFYLSDHFFSHSSPFFLWPSIPWGFSLFLVSLTSEMSDAEREEKLGSSIPHPVTAFLVAIGFLAAWESVFASWGITFPTSRWPGGVLLSSQRLSDLDLSPKGRDPFRRKPWGGSPSESL